MNTRTPAGLASRQPAAVSPSQPRALPARLPGNRPPARNPHLYTQLASLAAAAVRARTCRHCAGQITRAARSTRRMCPACYQLASFLENWDHLTGSGLSPALAAGYLGVCERTVDRRQKKFASRAARPSRPQAA